MVDKDKVEKELGFIQQATFSGKNNEDENNNNYLQVSKQSS